MVKKSEERYYVCRILSKTKLVFSFLSTKNRWKFYTLDKREKKARHNWEKNKKTRRNGVKIRGWKWINPDI